MSMFDPKEIIAIVKKENWNTIKEFSKDLIEKTLKKAVPYDLIIQKGVTNGQKPIIPTHTIREFSQLKILDTLEDFKSITFYQSDGIIRNIISITSKMLSTIFGDRIFSRTAFLM
jgi:hypothetical protein